MITEREHGMMTPVQRSIVERLVQRQHWYFSSFYHRSCFLRQSVRMMLPDGSVHRYDFWNRRGIKVTPSGKILLVT